MKHFRKLTGPYFAWLVLFVLIPLVLIAIYAFTTSGNPVKTLNFTLMNFAKINESTYIKVFIKSIEMGVLTTGVCLILGYPMAYLIAKCPEEMQDMLIMAVTIPTWINMLLRTYAWMNLLSDNGIINGLLGMLGIDPGNHDVYEFFCCCGYGLQLYAVYDHSDSYFTEKNGQFSH